jgi:oligoribonuclease (3'-5' exoribonuclease)
VKKLVWLDAEDIGIQPTNSVILELEAVCFFETPRHLNTTWYRETIVQSKTALKPENKHAKNVNETETKKWGV